MKNKKYAKISLVVVLCLAMTLPFIPFKTEAAVNNFAAAGTGFRGKKLSILGDSISTYVGISNNTSYNTTIGKNAVYYNETNHKLLGSAADTWWMQAMDELGMSLCVNNSWSGSCASDRENPGEGSVAYVSRCTQLHNNNTNTNPDIIAIYLGTNDIKNLTSADRLKNRFKDDYPVGATMNADGTATVIFNYSTVTGKVSDTSYRPASILEAYALMVYRSLNKYPNAEVYCFTLQPTDSQNQFNREVYALYNAGIRAIVKHFNDAGKKIYLVDVAENIGIKQDLALMNLFLAETHHPNALGMDAITNCFLSSLVANSQYSSEKFDNKVTYELNDSYVTTGQVTSAATGNKFSVTLLPTHAQYDLNVTVTMNGTDVTDTAVMSGDINKKTVLINNVTGPIHIKADAVYETRNYRWETKDGVLKACAPDGKNYHISGEIDTSELVHNQIYKDGSFLGTQYQLSEPMVLRNEEPWVLEWKGTGKWSSNMLLTEKSNDTARNNSYLFFNSTTLLGLGYRKLTTNGKWTDESGVERTEYPSGFTNFAASTSGVTLDSTTSHTFRLVNKVSDDANEVYLYVDNEEIGALNNYYAGNGSKGITDNWVSGKDFVFSYMGSASHPLKDCNIDYVQVWEGGSFDDARLTQLQQEFETLKNTVSGYTGFADYQSAVNASKNFSDTQEQCDAYADAIISARNSMTLPCDSNIDSGQIIGVELLSGDYARIGKQVGLRIITAPDVERISVGNEEFSSVSAMVQTMKVNSRDTLVKVWVVNFRHDIISELSITYGIETYIAGDNTAKATFDKTVNFK